jgi:hypothetical protein
MGDLGACGAIILCAIYKHSGLVLPPKHLVPYAHAYFVYWLIQPFYRPSGIGISVLQITIFFLPIYYSTYTIK